MNRKNVQAVASPLLYTYWYKSLERVPGNLLPMAVILIKTYIVTVSIM